MSTDLAHVVVDTPEKKALVGELEQGTRFYCRKGSWTEFGKWNIGLVDAFGATISAAGVASFLPVSRAAVYKRIKEGRLTAFGFEVSDAASVPAEHLLNKIAASREQMAVLLVPFSECEAWAADLHVKGKLTKKYQLFYGIKKSNS